MEEQNKQKKEPNIQVTKNGPYIVSGNVPLYRMIIKCDNSTKIPRDWLIASKLPIKQTYSLCRCGKSKNPPFCDGTHVKIKFEGSEEFDNLTHEQMAKHIDGPKLLLKDAEILCASARFCHRGGDIWDQIQQTNNQSIKENCIRNAFDCPSGRLVLFDKEKNKIIEPELETSIAVIEDPIVGVSGPIWVRGGITIYSAKGKQYEIRNRVTLCRCGKSTIKPFCDSSHYPEEFQEER